MTPDTPPDAGSDAAPSLKVKVQLDADDFEQQITDLTKLSSRFSASLSQAFVDATVKGKSLSDTLSTLALRLSEITLKGVFAPLTDQLGAGLANFATNAGGVFNPTGFAKGGAFAGGAQMPVPFADGGVIASPIGFPLAGNRSGIAGEAGPEAILPLTRGPDGSLGVRSAGAPSTNITFNVTTPDTEGFRRSQTQIAAMLARAVAQGQRNL